MFTYTLADHAQSEGYGNIRDLQRIKACLSGKEGNIAIVVILSKRSRTFEIRTLEVRLQGRQNKIVLYLYGCRSARDGDIHFGFLCSIEDNTIEGSGIY